MTSSPTSTLPLPLFRFAAWADDDSLLHAVTTRHGGVSRPPWATLNLASTRGDDPAAVDENHNRLCRALGVARADLVTGFLTHTDTVQVVTDADKGARFRDTDALVTATPGVPLILRFGDCVPILFYDPRRRAIGIAHAGWRGTLKLITQRTAQTMVDALGCRGEDIQAAIGPSIGPCCYEVGPEVVAQTRVVFGAQAEHVLVDVNGRQHLDLWAANRVQLEAIGVRQVETAGVCTACQVADYFSHRAERGDTGRFAAVIALRP